MNERKLIWPALWLFAVLRIPYGVFTGFIRTPLPYLLRGEGVSVDQIANILSLISIPSVIYFLWSPLVDFGLRRKNWLLLASLASALALAFAITQSSLSSALTVDLLVVGFSINLLTSSASGGLLATALPEERRTGASGWYQAGSLGAGTLAGGLILLLAQHYSKTQVAWMAAFLLFLPALSAFSISESAPLKAESFLKELGKIGHELKSTFWTTKNLAGLLLVIAPIGTGTAASLFAGMAPDYHVTGEQVGWFNGLGGGILLALGALIGGLAPIRWDRRITYVAAGCLNALVSIFLWVTPISPLFYFTGLGLYQFTTGICYACFTALVLNILGDQGRSISSRYTIMVGLSNAPVVYMAWIEGRGYHALGLRSVAAIDGLGNLLVAAVFLIYVVKSARAHSRDNQIA
jgi:PAT family beta-lactamase induction signal transducer AmpG